MTPSPGRPPVRISTPAGLLAVIPFVLGFTPTDSLVVIGSASPLGRIRVALRYDLPTPPAAGLAGEIAAHATAVLARQRATSAVIAGYGPGRLVTPVADAARQAAARTGVILRVVLRVEGGRYWSNPKTPPQLGMPLEPAAVCAVG